MFHLIVFSQRQTPNIIYFYLFDFGEFYLQMMDFFPSLLFVRLLFSPYRFRYRYSEKREIQHIPL